MARTLRVSDLSPVDVVRITHKAELIAREYERYHEQLSEDAKLTLKILCVMAVTQDMLAGDGSDGHE